LKKEDSHGKKQQHLSRRDVLKGTAAVSALLIPGAIAVPSAHASQDDPWQDDGTTPDGNAAPPADEVELNAFQDTGTLPTIPVTPTSPDYFYRSVSRASR
jgi:hypothetical protein